MNYVCLVMDSMTGTRPALMQCYGSFPPTETDSDSDPRGRRSVPKVGTVTI